MPDVIELPSPDTPEPSPDMAAMIAQFGSAIIGELTDGVPFAGEMVSANIVAQLERPVASEASAAQDDAEQHPADRPTSHLAADDEAPGDLLADVIEACGQLGTRSAGALALAAARYASAPQRRDAAARAAAGCDLGDDAGRLAALGAMSATRAWWAHDHVIDQANIVIEWVGPNREVEGLVGLLDWGRGHGYLKDLFPVDEADLGVVRDELAAAATRPDGPTVFEQIEPRRALEMLATGLRRAAAEAEGLPLEPDSLETHLALAARLRDAAIEPAATAPMTDQQLADAVAAFLASSEGRELIERVGEEPARRWAAVVARHGADDERGLGLRVGGWRTEEFLFATVDRPRELSPQAASEVAATVRAWTDWRIGEEGIDGPAAARLRASTAQLTQQFEQERGAAPAPIPEDRRHP